MTEQRRTPVWAVICGAIRRPIEFKFTLTELVRLRNLGLVDAIVLSTWLGEIDEHEGLRFAVHELGIHIVESSVPNELGPWAIFGQHKCLMAGMSLCPEDCFVLKSRTDKAFEMTWSFQEYLLKGSPKIDENIPSIFSHKIVCTSFSTTMLMFVADFCFLAHRRDARKLINFDGYYDHFQCGRAALPENRWFSGPFLREFPFLDWLYLNVPWVQLSTAIMAYTDAGAKSPLPDVVRDALALNLLIMDNYFATTLSAEWPTKFDSRNIFSVSKPSFPGMLTAPGHMWTLTTSSSLVNQFLSNCKRPKSKNIDDISVSAKAGFYGMGWRESSPKDLSDVFDFIKKWNPKDVVYTDNSIVTFSSDSDLRDGDPFDVLKIFNDIDVDRDYFMEVVPEIVSHAGGFGVPAALLKKGLSLVGGGQVEMGMKLIESAAAMDDVGAILCVAEWNVEMTNPTSRDAAHGWASKGLALATRFKLPEEDRLKAIVDATKPA